ncbi:hypothetical protein RM6536_1488 [Rothia mucilaginosa]|uniref:Uncharacterized protein n=1 Tax=Rothia mucilaginosa TaxID=43675 RepID=A0A0K2S125_9MICC|nr:hypothetical protein RM6536_1488 [Rothia mucilaginosa]
MRLTDTSHHNLHNFPPLGTSRKPTPCTCTAPTILPGTRDGRILPPALPPRATTETRARESPRLPEKFRERGLQAFTS